MFYVNCIKCILSDPLIVIESFEINFEVIQKILLVPWPVSELSNVVLSVRPNFLFGSSVCTNLKPRAVAMLFS